MFYRQITWRYSKTGSQENAFKKSKNPSAFLCKTTGSNNPFTLIRISGF